MLNEFINNKIKSINVLVLTERNSQHSLGLYPSALKIKEACEKRGFPFYPILVPGSTYVSDLDQKSPNIIIRDIKTKTSIELEPNNTVVIIRGSVVNNQNISSFLTYLESKGVFIINSKNAIDLCANKYNTTVRLMAGGVPVPRTSLITNIKELDGALKVVGNQFPVILKTLRGSAGIGVSRIDSHESLIGVLQAFWKHRAQLLIQEYLNADFDVRTIILDGKIISSMKRKKIKGDFRSNFSLGGDVEPYQLSNHEQKIVLDSAKLCGTFYCGVDHMVVDGKPYVIEVNASPGSTGMFKATKINVIDNLIDYISDKNNWIKNKTEIGYLEKINIPEIGVKLDATADTGNGMYNVLNAENMKKIDNIVSFTCNGKKIVKKIEKIVKVNVGGVRDFIDERPLVKFDVEFNGSTYKDVIFTLDDRPEPLAPVLLCRDFLSEVGVVINPKLKFSLGENVSFKDFRKMFI